VDAFPLIGAGLIRKARGITNGVSSARNGWSSDLGAATLAGLTPQQYYGLLWDFYLNTSYLRAPGRDPFNVIARYLSTQRIYTRTRGIYNPVTRLVDFYVANIHGGRLDMAAGDNSLVPSALPIITQNPDIRPALSQLWKWSNWDINKADYVRYGATLGNSAIRVVDDLRSEQVRLEVVYPGEVVDMQLDSRGNVIYWLQEYQSQDNDGQPFMYGLEITRETFRTFKDGQLFSYDDGNAGSTWENPYGFVPCVWVKHKNSGGDLGLCAYHHALPKINDLNELASHLSEQVKKTVHVQWLIAGASAPTSGEFESGNKIWSVPQPDARPYSLNDNLDIKAVVELIMSRVEEIEKDFPELTFHKIKESMGSSGDTPARAVRIAMHDAIAQTEEARVTYDSGLVRAQKMAMSIGGFRSYRGFEPFDLEDDFINGRLDHQIGVREVIPWDEFELTQLAQQNAIVGNELAKLELESGLSLGEIALVLAKYKGALRSGAVEDAASLTILSDDVRSAHEEQAKLAVETQRKALEAPATPPKPSGGASS
jgi:hypothetical protein